MIRAIPLIALCLVSAATGQEVKKPIPKGVWAFMGTVSDLAGDVLNVTSAGGEIMEAGKVVKLKLNDESCLEEVDSTVVDGKPTRTRKTIKARVLYPSQPISVICYSDGQELILLNAVAAGPSLAGVELSLQVARLGGKAQRFNINGQIHWEIDLKGTQTSDADLAGLGPIQNLRDLDLSFTRVTDKGVAGLAGHKDLHRLSLLGTKVTDAAIADLRQLPRLFTINLAETGITADGIARLVKNKSCDVCPVALGDKARFRVFHEYVQGSVHYNYLMINDTYFGRYYPGTVSEPPGAKAEDRRRLATTYYHRHGPVGQVLAKLEWFKPAGLLDYPSDSRLPASLVGVLSRPGTMPADALVGLWSEPAIGVVRLNVGTHAAYGRPFQAVDFYNSTPELKTFSLPDAGQAVYFGFLREALKRGCNIHVIDGAERVSLAKKAPQNFYSALFVEITRDDLRDINTDLLTKEAIAEMMGSLSDAGILCFHTSHRYHDLVPPIVDAAASLKLSWKLAKDQYTAAGSREGHFSSEWLMIARRSEDLKYLTDVNDEFRRVEWSTPKSTGKHLWRDGQARDLRPLARQK